ncbi:Cytotoxic and regulatory T-cell molecule [Orchesella cincta]|uniref:Cytotoxic and regulatory T-cell molecule n=1 Tax=Orchesella cincta TaxID=48709 RepID=A0A1D2NF38_ORCCI|nr:Cytotoxic and regulatory T-cell molecule [Orchesella cincta]
MYNIDYKRPNRVAFKLKNLKLSSSGTYKCEVSADAPTFKTLHDERNLSIIVLPNPSTPRLTGFTQQGHLGDRVKGNCTYMRSFPPANLTFLVNEVNPVLLRQK